MGLADARVAQQQDRHHVEAAVAGMRQAQVTRQVAHNFAEIWAFFGQRRQRRRRGGRGDEALGAGVEHALVERLEFGRAAFAALERALHVGKIVQRARAGQGDAHDSLLQVAGRAPNCRAGTPENARPSLESYAGQPGRAMLWRARRMLQKLNGGHLFFVMCKQNSPVIQMRSHIHCLL